MEIIAEPIGAVEVKVLTNQTRTCQARKSVIHDQRV